MSARTVQVPASRLARWVAGFGERHGGANESIVDGRLHLAGTDTATATLSPPFPVRAASTADFIDAVARVPRTGVILIRRGGFAAAIVEGTAVIASDVGKRHVQGRTAAGGWSQQRFARRRDKQVHELVDAAVGYVVRTVLPALPVVYLATGGDGPLIEAVLEDPRLRPLRTIARGPHLDVPDPRRDVVNSLPERLTTVSIELIDP
ncbi:MAG: acVLRF1 family peptidyl-tRNA hydrolase [Candidatus Nanopelagicales bacterium]|jgi:hypothetical protein